MPERHEHHPPDEVAVGAVDVWSPVDQHERGAGDRRARSPTDDLGADPLDDPGAQRGDITSMIRGERQQADAGLERRVAEHELQVLGQQEDRAEHREERQRDAEARGA